MEAVTSYIRVGARVRYLWVSRLTRNCVRLKSSVASSTASPTTTGGDSRKSAVLSDERNFSTEPGSTSSGIKCQQHVPPPDEFSMKHQSLQDELLKLAESQAKSFLPKDAKDDVYFLPHKPWEFGQAKGIKEHHEPHGPMERAAFQTAQFLRGLLDNIAGYEPSASARRQKDPEKMWPKRFILLEAVSCVTTAQAARAQHVRSMWKGEPDNGWCRALLLESDNERVHLLTALKITHANRLVRMGIITLQSVVSPFSFIAYVMCPKYCHRLYEYLQEESIKIYTQCIEDIEEGSMDLWKNQVAPTIAKKYWHLKDDATVEDVLKAIRADEDKHRCTHHMLANAKYVVNLDPTKLPQ